MKFTVFFVVFIFVFIENSFAQGKFNGDLEVHNGSSNLIAVRIYCSSIPFDGLVQNRTSWAPLNRIDTLQNGSYTRLFKLDGSVTNYPLYYHYTELSPLVSYVLGLVGGNPTDSNSAFGHAKYTIVLEVKNTNIKYISTFNYLDSKSGSSVNGNTYGADICLNFSTVGQPIEVTHDNNIFIGYINPYQVGQPIPEFKIWEICGFGNTPLEKRFYARTTPFGISPEVIFDSYMRNFTMREFEVGTKVIFDHVYDNYSSTDRWGYNTFKGYVGGEYLDYYSNPKIPQGQNLPGYTYTTPVFYTIGETDFEYGCRINAISGDELILKNNMRLWVSAYNRYIDNTGDTIAFYPGSILTKEQNAQLNACFGGTILDYGSTLNWEQNSFSHIFTKSEYSFLGSSHTINNGGHIEIDNLARLKVGDNTTVTFDGTGTYLKLNSGAIVQLGQNAKIEFKNGAYIDADGVTFSGINGATWNSIFMENAGESTIKNCTFSNANVPIQIINTNGTGANSSKIISANHFNPSASHCVYAENVKNMLFENNNVYPSPSKVGLYVKNNTSFGSNNDGAAHSSDNVIIKGNTFYDGHIPIILACYTSGYTSFLVQNNTFNGNNVVYDFVGREMGGDLKSNHSDFTPSVNRCFQLTQSNPNLYGNIMTSGLANIYNDASYPNMAPLIQNGQFIWIGGYNQLSCSQSSNIDFHTGIAKLDYGHNCFYRQDISKYHLVGSVNSENDQYFVRDNSFNSSPVPSYSLIDAITMNPVVAISGNPNIYILCNAASAPTTWLLQDKGFGIIDSIPVTVENTGEQIPPDVQLFGMAEQNTLQNNYTTAIDEFKTLINNYPASDNINNALYDLYRCYEGIDTSALQSHRNLIYGDLKTYLENKILSGLYSNEFTDIAYNITLMCLVNMTEYEESKTGYEFIALYHPDAYIRLMASWDYAEVDNLINGAGGESDNKELISDRKYMVQLEKKFEKMIPKNPVLNKVKEIYDSKRNEKYDKLNEQYKSAASKKEKEEINKAIISLKAEDEKSAAKVTLVLRRANKMEPEERSKRQFEDLVMTTENQNKSDKVINNLLPLSYQLSQNYPNPFNPVTKINFAIQKQGLVTLKVYDMLGREVAALVNEFKQAGYYSLDFNASGLSSGIYFYKLQANDFTDIKKMVLIK